MTDRMERGGMGVRGEGVGGEQERGMGPGTAGQAEERKEEEEEEVAVVVVEEEERRKEVHSG